MSEKSKLSQILTLISKAKKENLITDDEKTIIKVFIIEKEPDLTTDLEKYNKDKDLNSLVQSLKTYSDIEGVTSPMDTLIFKHKKNTQHKHKSKKNDDEKNEDEFKCEECDLGASPVVNPVHFKKKK